MTVTVLYIAGLGHSGSTVLGDALGTLPGVFYGGEILHLSRRLARDAACDCGVTYRECRVWAKVLESMMEAGVPARSLQDGSWRDDPLARTYLYRSLSKAAGAKVIVDGSKRPEFAKLLGDTPGIRLQVIHLVRDGRANVLSRVRRGKRRALRDATPVRVFMTVLSDAHKWSKVNALSAELRECADWYVLVRYEDFASNPESVLDGLRAHLGLPDAPDQSWSDGVRIEGKHTVYGNRDHRNLDRLVIRLDDRWLAEMGGVQFLVVTAVQASSLSRYGYPLGRKLPLDLGRTGSVV